MSRRLFGDAFPADDPAGPQPKRQFVPTCAWDGCCRSVAVWRPRRRGRPGPPREGPDVAVLAAPSAFCAEHDWVARAPPAQTTFGLLDVMLELLGVRPDFCPTLVAPVRDRAPIGGPRVPAPLFRPDLVWIVGDGAVAVDLVGTVLPPGAAETARSAPLPAESRRAVEVGGAAWCARLGFRHAVLVRGVRAWRVDEIAAAVRAGAARVAAAAVPRILRESRLPEDGPRSPATVEVVDGGVDGGVGGAAGGGAAGRPGEDAARN